MFNALQLKEMMTANPFRPFRICMSDGKTYDIPNHEAAFVKRNSIEVAIDPDAEGIAGKFAQCAILHITRIEELQAA